MNYVWLYSLVSVTLVSLVSLVGILFLFLKDAWLKRLVFILISLSVGSLFADAFIHLIPEAFSELSSTTASLYILLGLVIFFILEKFIHWRHQHNEESVESLCDHDEDCQKIHPVGYMVLVGDGVHNFIDGIIIAASFLVSVEVGIATTIAVTLHEIPQEVGHFAVLIHSGFSKLKALLYNLISALTSILGAILTLFWATQTETLVPYFIAIAAGGFIYIAGSDLVPQLHKQSKVGESLIQLISILVGVGIMLLLLLLE
ncbi:MAG: ZIP family metal transporter [Minisyncoccia bacterium]